MRRSPRILIAGAVGLALLLVSVRFVASTSPFRRPAPQTVANADRPRERSENRPNWIPPKPASKPDPVARPRSDGVPAATRDWRDGSDGRDAARAAAAPPPPSRWPITRTDQLLLVLSPGTDPAALARDLRLKPLRSLTSQPSWWVYSAGTVEAALQARAAAARDPRVEKSFLNPKVHMSRLYIPNDPYYTNGNPPGFPGQWYLTRANLEPIWNDPVTHAEVTGAGVIMAIQDDCLEFTHPDLAGNFDAADSLNFGDDAPSDQYGPNPNYDFGTNGEDRHGTSVAGVAAAVGGNGIGITGAAPKARIAINRMNFFDGTPFDQFPNGVLYHSSAGSAIITIKNHSYGFNVPYIDNSGEDSAITDSAAVGTLHVFAAGNYFGSAGEDSNKMMPQNNVDVITVAAVGSDDKFAFYSNFGACVFCTAPSSSGAGTNGVTSTDRMGGRGYNPVTQYPDSTTNPPLVEVDDNFPDQGYTSNFGGTSSSAPLVSGILALGKQANPAMTIRMAQHALVRSCDVVDPTDKSIIGDGDGVTSGSAWKTNNAGFKFNQNYGFGIINATKFVHEVVKYTGVNEATPETHSASFTSTLSDPSPGLHPVSQTFTVTGTTPLEAVRVTLDLSHARRGDLEAYLTSPKGTKSRLMIRETADIIPDPSDPSGNTPLDGPFPDPYWGISAWTFTSYAFWGEVPTGLWTITVVDTIVNNANAVNTGAVTGTWNGYTFTAYMGTPILDTTPPSVLSITKTGTSPTNAGPLTYTVKFSEYVAGVGVSDFALTTTGSIAGASVTSVTGGVDTYTVTVNPGSGSGTIRLDLIDDDSITDGAGNKLGGTGVGNGTFTAGDVYTFDNTPATISVTSTTSDGTYGLNAAINITLNFSKPLTLSSGFLNITLDTGYVLSIPAFGSVSSVSGTYTVQAGQHSPDLTVVSPLALTSGTLQDALGNNALLTIAPASNLAAAHAIVVDAAAPTGGVVVDGLSGADLSSQTSLTTMAAHWSGWTDVGTGIAGYRWAIGTSPGASNVMPFTDVGLATAASTSFLNINLSLSVGTTYFVTVEARDGAGTKGTASSDGVQVVAGGSATIPLPPGRLDALALPTGTDVKLIWIPSPTVGVTGYRLWYKPAASPWTSATLADNLPAPTTTVSGLTTGTSYDFQLRALTAGGNESSSVYTTGIPQFAITINGSGSGYGDVQTAINAASAGQTVLVQAGTYTQNLTLKPGVTLSGTSPAYTILTATSGDVITAPATATPTTVQLLTVTGGQVGINVGTSPVTIRNVVIHDTGGDGVLALASSTLQVLSCTIAHTGAVGIDAGGATTVRNVIATGNAGNGIVAPAGATVTYTDSYNNSGPANFSGGFSLGLDYSLPVLFTDEAGSDYTEQQGSASIDAGDPADPFALEPDYNGGRINLGAYGNTSFAATSPLPATSTGGGGGGGGGGGCGLTGFESLLLLAAVTFLRRRIVTALRQ